MSGDRTELLRMDVRCDPAAPAAVRGAMSSLRGLGWALGDAMIVASELVTKTVRHTGCPHDHWITVAVSRTPDGLSILVTDPNFTRPEPESGTPGEVELDGLALVIVRQLASDWGAKNGDGYRIWADVPVAA
jgi:hypothetical protein